MNKKSAFAALLLFAMLFAVSAFAEATGSAATVPAVGDYVTFGLYEQDNVLDNGKEPIEWRVLKAENGELLLISKYALDTLPYNEERAYAKWETCTLRAWLHDEFYNAAFSDEEKAVILTKETKNWKSTDTMDTVSLLDNDEAKTLFADHPDRQCTPTPYTVSKGAYLSVKYQIKGTDYPNVNWWLRTKSWENKSKGTYVAASGGVMTCGGHSAGYVEKRDLVVRPVIYVNAEAFAQQIAQ